MNARARPRVAARRRRRRRGYVVVVVAQIRVRVEMSSSVRIEDPFRAVILTKVTEFSDNLNRDTKERERAGVCDHDHQM